MLVVSWNCNNSICTQQYVTAFEGISVQDENCQKCGWEKSIIASEPYVEARQQEAQREAQRFI
jgi:hypothetical protein